ncbi:MAG: response regulator transcription factor [Alphaproteobacteria bacterium]|nr:response regulator transcription factor [Alphaproteobacteria bacterium]
MKILIADDHTLFRDALIHYIERSAPDFEIQIAKDFYQVQEILEEDSTQDLILLDLRMPGMKGLEGLRYIRENFPQCATALMSGVAEEEDVKQALDYGAIGYFPKTMSGKGFVSGINKVLAGERFIPVDPVNGGYAPSYYGAQERPPEDEADKRDGIYSTIDEIGFTPRENQVLTHLIKGESNKEIARALDLQVVTVKLHVRGICRKLGAKNRTHAAMKAKDLELLKYAEK